jgi:uncharacterized repeat protein (TIGR02543 family)
MKAAAWRQAAAFFLSEDTSGHVRPLGAVDSLPSNPDNPAVCCSWRGRAQRVVADRARTTMSKDGRMIQNIARTRAHTMASLGVLFALVGCGGGASPQSVTPTPSPAPAPTPTPTPAPTPTPGSQTLTLNNEGSGTLTSTTAGASCSAATCSTELATNTAVTLTAVPAANYAFGGWAGGCSGTSTTCTVTLSSSKTVTANFSPKVPVAGVPWVRYTDTVSAPTTGGENSLGGYLSIFGSNFGAASGLGSTTKVYIGGAEVANYRYLGPAKVGSQLGLQQLTVQVGNLGGAAVGTTVPVLVVVNGVPSNMDATFTPTNGKVWFVATTGNDATGVAGDITHPMRYMQNMTTSTGAYFKMGAGDQVVLRGGSYSDTNGVDTSWMKFGAGSAARNGTAKAWIHITAYPGPIKGNAIEDVHYTTPSGASGGIQGPWSAIAGTSGEYIAISNLRMDVAGGAARDAAPINFQYTGGHWRVVNNELGPWVAGNSAILNAAGISGHGDTMLIYGNHIHDIQGVLADLQNHGIYADTTAQNWEVAYNWINNMTGGSAIQFNDNEGGAGSYALPHGGTWAGFTGIKIHHNWIQNAAKYGVNFNDQQSSKAGKYSGMIWDNVIIGTALPPLRINSTQPVQQLWFAYNTIYDCMTTSSGSGNAYVRPEGWSSASGVNNVFYDNIFAFGPHTVAGTQWFYDAESEPASTTTYSFKNNLYSAGSQTPDLFSLIGDLLGLSGDPLFVSVTLSAPNFTTQSGSPARKSAKQALPSGFAVVDDFTGTWRGAATSDVGALYTP